MPAPGDILVVDDTMTTLMMLLALLSTEGYQASSAQSGAEALELVRKHPPDLILLDFSMPDMDGLQVCRQLKASSRTRDIPILFLSSIADTQAKVDGFAAGAVDFIGKPFERSELLARVNTHLDLARLKKRLSKLVDEKTESLRLSEQRFRAMIEQAPEAIMVYDLDSSRYVDANQQAEALTGRQQKDLIGMTPVQLYSPEQPDGLPTAESVRLHAARAMKGEVQVFERVIARPDGSNMPCEVRLSKLPSETGRLLRVSYIDISPRVAAQEKINRLAYFDALTGLLSQSGLLEKLDNLFNIRQEANLQGFAMLLIDLGDFKSINDVYGNSVGDLLLCEVAERLRRLAGAGNLISRLAGIEFVAVLSGIHSREKAEQAADEALEALSRPFIIDEMTLNITVSIGVSLGPEHGASGQELLRNADMALYKAKQQSKRRVQVFEAALSQQMRETGGAGKGAAPRHRGKPAGAALPAADRAGQRPGGGRGGAGALATPAEGYDPAGPVHPDRRTVRPDPAAGTLGSAGSLPAAQPLAGQGANPHPHGGEPERGAIHRPRAAGIRRRHPEANRHPAQQPGAGNHRVLRDVVAAAVDRHDAAIPPDGRAQFDRRFRHRPFVAGLPHPLPAGHA